VKSVKTTQMDQVELQRQLGGFVRRVLEANEDGRRLEVNMHAGIARTSEPGDTWESHIHDGSVFYTISIGRYTDLDARIEADRAKRRLAT